MERIYGLLLFPNSAVMSLSPEDLRFYIEDITDIAEWSTNVHVHIMELKDQHAIDRQVNRRSMPAKLACKRNILSHCMNEYQVCLCFENKYKYDRFPLLFVRSPYYQTSSVNYTCSLLIIFLSHPTQSP